MSRSLASYPPSQRQQIAQERISEVHRQLRPNVKLNEIAGLGYWAAVDYRKASNAPQTDSPQTE